MEKTLEHAVNEALELMLKNAKSVLTIDECATYTGYSVRTLYDMAERRQIPHYKCGKKLFFKRLELEKWLTRNKVLTTEEIGSMASRKAIRL